MNPYLPHTEEDVRAMLETIGARSIEELFETVPKGVRLSRPLSLPAGKSEHETRRELEGLSRRNSVGAVCFLGAGIYDHLIPAVVPHILSRSEFATAYTPYQPEMSQGILQAIFEFQSMICRLTGLEVSNASLYDGATAVSEAAALALNSVRGSDRVLVSRTVHPHARQVLATRFAGNGVVIREVEAENGVTSMEALDGLLEDRTAALIVQSPNVFGIVEDYTGLAELLHSRGVLLVQSANPFSLGVLKPPAGWGADIAIGDTQPFGLDPNYGGPTAGYIAASRKLLHRMPGRIVGQSLDRDGKRAFLLTLQAREQHIKRQRATSNICTNQALAALATTVHLAAVGREGLREAAGQSAQKAHYLFRRLSGELGLRSPFDRPFFNEFTLDLGRPAAPVLKRMEEAGILAGVPLERLFPDETPPSGLGARRSAGSIVVAVTEKRSREELDRYAAAMKEALQ